MVRKSLLGVAGVIIIIIAISVATVLSTPSDTTVPIPEPATTDNANQTNKGIRTIAQNLDVPWAIDIAVDNRIFFTEKPGRLGMIHANGTLASEPVVNIHTEDIGEAGLMGLALHPNFTQNHLMYVYHTYAKNGGLYNKVLMLTEKNNKIVNSKIILDGIPASDSNNGGRIKFGPDGKLYVSTGDSETPELAQNTKSLAGKLLRLNDDGTIPDDNPIPESPVYSYGHRDIQGFAWHPITKKLYASEHGPAGNDEVNIIEPGSNYGWPIEVCNHSTSSAPIRFETPEYCFNPEIAPSGLTIAASNKLGYQNDILFTTLRGSHLHHIDLETRIQDNVLVGYGRLSDIVEAHDGSLYVLTTNRNAIGIGNANDDHILQIIQK
ncbi:MAG: PQQ-dependent sugar dehydrogenase [Nitrososphaeraceae archaeon]|jgi:glucose/arabinose dehydrogenase